ncbi:hypothetical protein SYJ56_12775 [Algoriphagus sp. D3-2-R+10]|uniref:hypothetical protein n=1 Tax=Algoriphagus aurantiacus TaxID=3103948 RepID=UPI002B3B21D8|nr:hypothetical protein [Algoriphagus sp. D3-2-R+10]MEB2776189.1 hypothetical protein [Algoriphagus sp. D3-2-R+10]
MKKALSILLLACFVMYHFGYYAFYFSYDQHLESKWEDLIYSESSLEADERLIEIPLSMPYMANQEEFQTTNTPYEKNGKYYRAIKQRYQNDTLQLIVLPDAKRRVLDNTVKKWISVITEDELPQDHNSSITVKFFVKDYIQPNPFLFKAYSQAPIDYTIGYVFFQYINPAEGIESPPPQFS